MTDKSKIVREANSRGGPCQLLGPLLEEYPTGLVYRCQSGFKANIPKRLAHLEPCRSCPDHHRSRFPHLAFKCGPKQDSCSQTRCDCSWWKAVLCGCSPAWPTAPASKSSAAQTPRSAPSRNVSADVPAPSMSSAEWEAETLEPPTKVQ